MKNPKLLPYSFFLYITAFCLGARLDEWGILFAVPFLIIGLISIWKDGHLDVLHLVNKSAFIWQLAAFVLFAWGLVTVSFWISNTWGFDTLSYAQSVAHFALDGNYYNQSLHMPTVCDHFTPSLLVFYPLFALVKSSLWLLGGRWLCYVLSVWVFYRIATHFKLSTLSKNLLIFIYLIYYPTSTLFTYDFQPSNLALLLWPLTFFTWIKKKHLLSLFLLSFSLFLKENMGLLFCLLGLYIFLFEEKWKTGSALIAVGLLSSYFIFHSLTPLVAGCHNFHENYISPFSHLPRKGEMLLNMLIGVGFLPLRNWRCFLMILASLGLSFISGIKEMTGLGFHYHDIATATTFICLVLVLKDLDLEHVKLTTKMHKGLFSISFACIVLFNKYPPMADFWKHIPTKTDFKIYQSASNLETQLDANTELWVQNSLAHHFLSTKNLNSIQFLQSIASTDELLALERPHYVVLSPDAGIWPLDDNFNTFVSQLEEGTRKGVYVKEKGFEPLLVFRRVASF